MRMKISVITPSFNQVQYLPTTLESVASQINAEYEHIILDPGSTDGSLKLIEKYCQKHRFARYYFGLDKSQTNAINLGFQQASGDILCWLNSDDYYIDNRVFNDVCREFSNDDSIDVVYGRGIYCDSKGEIVKEAFIHENSNALDHAFIKVMGICQPAVFMRRSAFEKAGLLDEGMNFSFDYEYWVRLKKNNLKFHFMDRVLAFATIHDTAKTVSTRRDSLKECIQVCQRHYNFAPFEWVERLVDFENYGLDGFLKVRTPHDQALDPNLTKKRFIEFNADKNAIASILSLAGFPECHKSVQPIIEHLNTDLYLVTSFDSAYFDTGLTLLSGLCRHGYASTPKIVFDLGLTPSQRATLNLVKRTYVLEFNRDLYNLPSWYFKPKSYVYKLLAIEQVRQLAQNDDNILWIDAGVYPNRSLEKIIALINHHGAFFIDHDDRPGWPFYNIRFTSDDCCVAMKATIKEMMGEHVCSCLMGFKKGHELENLFHDAFRHSLDQQATLGDKHPEYPQRQDPQPASVVEDYRNRLMAHNSEFEYDLTDLRKIFGYGGHRQDQSIISLLVQRYNAMISSSTEFCIGSDRSSEISKLNWESGSHTDDIDPQLNISEKHKQAFTYHHRGLVINFENIEFEGRRKNAAVIIGNGPSLKGFDLTRLRGFDTLGMNAAYRYWKEIHWYPRYYACLDLVVGAHHCKEIFHLIQNSDRLGIEYFLLRESLINELGEVDHPDKIVNFDFFRRGCHVLQSDPITTGSHSCAWATLLGYRQIYLLGIDCNYVNIDKTAELGQDGILTIVRKGENQNYFFNGYQQIGDRFNIPNPSPDLHIRSWRNMADRIDTESTKILNANPHSQLDVFPLLNPNHFNAIIETQSKIYSSPNKSRIANLKSCLFEMKELLMQRIVNRMNMTELKRFISENLKFYRSFDGFFHHDMSSFCLSATGIPCF